MSTPYSARLFAGAVPPAGTVAVYTVPAGHVAIIQHMDALTGSSPPEVLFVEIVAGGVTVAYISLEQVIANVSVAWSGKIVLNQGESINIAPAAGTWTIQISGSVLSLL